MVDLLRGFVIALMVLDHTRDYFHVSAYTFDPTDPQRTHVWLYLTRWVTHLCAPTFVFLAGVSVYLQGANGKSKAALTRFLLTRGAWLIVLELTVISFGLNFALPFVFLQVIWAIGASMIMLAGVIWLPRAAAAVIGVLIVAGHQLLAPIDSGGRRCARAAVDARVRVWPVADRARLHFLSGSPMVRRDVSRLRDRSSVRRRTRAPQSNAARARARRNRVFFVLRAINAYGDPAPWTAYPRSAATVMSFFNVSKYPPSLLYVLITLGVSLLCLLAFQRMRGLLARMLLAYGRTPLFTYVLHIYVVHVSSLLVAVLAGYPASYHANFLADPFRLVKAGWGFNLQSSTSRGWRY